MQAQLQPIGTIQLPDYWSKTQNWILSCCRSMPNHTSETIRRRIKELSGQISEHFSTGNYQTKSQLASVNQKLEELRIFFRLSQRRMFISQNQYKCAINQINFASRNLSWK